MADTKISLLGAIPALDGADVLPIVDATDTTTKKVSITQLDGRYATAAQGTTADGAIQKSLVDAKGDLIVATAADTVTRVAVGGTNGHVLTVDSAEASGVKWAAAAGGSYPALESVVPATSASLPGAVFTSGSTMAWGPNNLFLQPIYVPEAITVTAMQVRISGAGTASSVARLGIYETTSALGGGGNLILDAGTVAADSTGVKEITGLSQALAAGWYFLVMIHNSAANPTWVYYAYHNGAQGTAWRGHDLSVSNLDYINKTPLTYGTLAATAPASPTLTWSSTYGTRSFIYLRWT